MNIQNPNQEKSEGGSSILRYRSENDWEAASEEGCTDLISDHIETHLGPIKTVIHEIASDTVHIDVHIVPPLDEFPFFRLVTSGMSDRPMTVPKEECPRFSELMITFPGDWDFDSYNDQDPRWNWPISLLRYLARFPHKYNSWLGWGHTVPNGNPASPFDSSTPFSGALILPPANAPEGFHQLAIDSSKVIQFYSVIPIYESEMEFKLKKGTNSLIELFERFEVSDVINPNRKSVVTKPWWQLW